MKKIKLIILFILLSVSVFSQDFRGFLWGTDIATVMHNETIRRDMNPLEDLQQLCYNVKIGDIKAFVIYQFTESRLSSGLYTISRPDKNTWSKLEKALKHKYKRVEITTRKSKFKSKTTYITLEHKTDTNCIYISYEPIIKEIIKYNYEEKL